MTTSSDPRNHVMFVTYCSPCLACFPSLPSAHAIGFMVCFLLRLLFQTLALLVFCMTTSSFLGNHVMFVTYHLPSLPSAYAIGFMVSLSWLHLLLSEITSWCCLHDFVYHLCLLLTQSAVWLAPNYYFFTLSCWLSMFSVLGVFSGFPSCLGPLVRVSSGFLFGLVFR